MTNPSSHEAIGWLIVAIVALVTGVNQIWKLSDRIHGRHREQSITPQPLLVATPEQFARQEEFAEHVRDNSQKFDKLALQREEDLRIAALARRKMHEDIQAVGREVAALTATTETQTNQLGRLDKKLDDVPDRVIATLRNTGAIGGGK